MLIGVGIGALSDFTVGLRPLRLVVVVQELLQSLGVRGAGTLAPDENGLSAVLATRQCVDRQSLALSSQKRASARGGATTAAQRLVSVWHAQMHLTVTSAGVASALFCCSA